MSEVRNEDAPAGLPCADGIAIGVGMALWFVTIAWPAAQTMIAAVIFLPPVLREMGLLRDVGSRIRAAAYRAAFHSLLFLVGMFVLSHALVRQGILTESEHATTAVLNESYLRGFVVGVYLVSYLLGVLGARRGSFAIFIGVAVVALTPLLGYWRTAGRPFAGLALIVAIPSFFVLLAFLAHRWPRQGGVALLGLFALGTSALLLLWRRTLPAEALLSAQLQMVLLLGCPGLALVREGGRDVAPARGRGDAE